MKNQKNNIINLQTKESVGSLSTKENSIKMENDFITCASKNKRQEIKLTISPEEQTEYNVSTKGYDAGKLQESIWNKCVTDTLAEFDMFYRNKKITLHLEFPAHQNKKAIEDFISRLKAIYIKKIETKIRQLEEITLQSTSSKEEETKHHA